MELGKSAETDSYEQSLAYLKISAIKNCHIWPYHDQYVAEPRQFTSLTYMGLVPMLADQNQ